MRCNSVTGARVCGMDGEDAEKAEAQDDHCRGNYPRGAGDAPVGGVFVLEGRLGGGAEASGGGVRQGS